MLSLEIIKYFIMSLKPISMKHALLLFIVVINLIALKAQNFSPDEYTTSAGKLKISFIGHGTLMFEFNGKVIHVDPWSKLADYTTLPKADLILVTHEHGDHFDSLAIKQVSKKTTTLVANHVVIEKMGEGEIMKNGDIKVFHEIKVEAVLAYNTAEGRDKFHPMGRDNGYIINFGNRRVYIAGDTENIPEMAFLKNIYIAFLPMNQPYTMLPEQVAEAVKMIKPVVLYPYHYGESDIEKLKSLLAAYPKTKVVIKPMK